MNGTRFVGTKDVNLWEKLLVEQYRLQAPRLTYRVLSIENSLVHDIYGTAEHTERSFTDVLEVPLRPVFAPEEMGLSAWAIDITRQILFRSSRKVLSERGIMPKIGDEIIYDGNRYEIATVLRREESQVGVTNEFLEFDLVANIPSPDLL